MNFISTFDELSKLYEEASLEKAQEEVVEESCNKEELTESAEEEIEIVDDELPAEEAPVEEPTEDEEPKQVVLECSKCGALMIKDEADIVVNEESGLANVEDKCAFCEETEGYKTIGTLLPYGDPEDGEPVANFEANEVDATIEEPSTEETSIVEA